MQNSKDSNNYKGNGLNINNEQQNNPNNNNNNNANDDIFGLGDLAMGGPVALGASQGIIGSQNRWKGSSANSGQTMVDHYGLSQIDSPQPMAAKQQQTSIRQQTVIMPKSSMFTPFNEPMGPSMGKPQLMVLPNNDDVVEDFSEFKSEPLFFVPSKVMGCGLTVCPAMYNEMTSVAVDETPKQCLSKFKLILDSFSNDIEYKVDEANYIINGTIFIRHFAVFFKISIWREMNNNDRTRFEFRRSKGDTVAFTEFWNEIEDVIYKQFSNVDGMKNGLNDDEMGGFGGFGGFGLPPIDYNFDLDLDLNQNDGDDAMDGLTSKDLDNFVYDIDQCDPSVVYSIAMLLDAFKVQNRFIQMIFNHAQFIKCIIESALTHQDTALVRGALITLERLCDSAKGADSLIGLNVLERVVPLLGSDCELIRKYAVRVLDKLSTAKSWTFSNQKLKKYAQISVRECQQKWEKCSFATNDFIQQKMFENINNALVSAN